MSAAITTPPHVIDWDGKLFDHHLFARAISIVHGRLRREISRFVFSVTPDVERSYRAYLNARHTVSGDSWVDGDSRVKSYGVRVESDAAAQVRLLATGRVSGGTVLFVLPDEQVTTELALGIASMVVNIGPYVAPEVKSE